jgi:hypothetical protein
VLYETGKPQFIGESIYNFLYCVGINKKYLSFKKYKLEVILHGTASNKALPFVVANLGQAYEEATTHPFD